MRNFSEKLREILSFAHIQNKADSKLFQSNSIENNLTPYITPLIIFLWRGSSHYTFRKAGCNPITIPNHEPIKVVYVRMVKEIVEAEEANKKKED